MRRIVFLLFLLVAGCAPATPRASETPAPYTLPASGGAAGAESLAAGLAQAGNSFGLALHRRLGAERGNVLFSPASIHATLAMVLAGSRGATAEELSAALRLRANPERIAGGFRALRLSLEPARGDSAPELSVANGLWVQREFPLLPDYAAALREGFAAEARQLDFARPAEAAAEINAWVGRATRERIRDLVEASMLGPDTRVVLTNAIYFKGRWKRPFEKPATRPEAFHPASGAALQVPTMRRTDSFLYAEDGRVQVLELPYAGDRLAMLVLLPRERNGLGAIEADLDPRKLAGWVGALARREVDVRLPRFRVETRYDLVDPLRALGVRLAFTDRAELGGVSAAESLTVSEVVHKAFVAVDEEGTEAAAATGAVVQVTSAGPPPVVFQADHPFLFAIRDRVTGAILFLGRLERPASA